LATDVTIESATLEHAAILAETMRQEDRDEVWATGRYTPAEALRASLGMSLFAKSGFADGELVCMWGLGSPNMVGNVGTPWLLGASTVTKHQVPFLRNCCNFRNEMLEYYDILRNWVDVRNTTSIRWLRWIGFEIKEPQPFGAFGLPFHPFEMRRA
jgi:hypothetical protein